MSDIALMTRHTVKVCCACRHSVQEKSLLVHIEVLNGSQPAACAAAQQKHNKKEAIRQTLADDFGCLQLQ